MLKQTTACTAFAAALSCAASASEVGSYSNNFEEGGGTHYGSSFVTYYNGHSDLQLVSDGQSGTYGTWQTGGFENQQITAFSASFKFSFKNDGGPADGFSFLFGDMTDMSGNNWEGGEWGLNAFNGMGSGMSIGFDSYGGDSGMYARWGGSNVAWTNFGSEWYNIATYSDYNQALDDYFQGTIQIEWDVNTGLDVGVSWPGYGMWWGLSTDMFTGDGMDTTDFTFGFAARNGGIDNDVLIDNLNINYTYNSIPAPSAIALLGLSGLCCGRRHRRN